MLSAKHPKDLLELLYAHETNDVYKHSQCLYDGSWDHGHRFKDEEFLPEQFHAKK